MVGGRGDFPYDRGKHLIVSARVYVFADESGIEDAAQYCLIGGYIGPPRQWQKLRRKWDKVLDQYGVPSFHAKDFFQFEKRKNREHYKDWSAKKLSHFLAALLTIINQRDLDPLSAGIYVPDFNTFSDEDRQYLTGGIRKVRAVGYGDGSTETTLGDFVTSGAPSKPFFGVFQRFVGDALLKAPPDTLVNFTFDRQDQYEARTVETFYEQFTNGHLPAELERKVGKIGHDKSADEPALQAADLLAYVWNRVMNETVRGTLLQQAVAAFSIKQPSMTVFRREHMQQIVDETTKSTLTKLEQVQKWLGR
jgi:hypothetical protein